jgi:hypothetical protein
MAVNGQQENPQNKVGGRTNKTNNRGKSTTVMEKEEKI